MHLLFVAVYASSYWCSMLPQYTWVYRGNARYRPSPKEPWMPKPPGTPQALESPPSSQLEVMGPPRPQVLSRKDPAPTLKPASWREHPRYNAQPRRHDPLDANALRAKLEALNVAAGFADSEVDDEQSMTHTRKRWRRGVLKLDTIFEV